MHSSVINSRGNIIELLRSRNLYDNCNDPGHVARVSEQDSKGFTCYIGFDLTADGLHVGHLSALMCVRHAMANGHHCIVLLGGGTTYIGDPSGKTETRKILSPEQINLNKVAICQDIFRILLPQQKLDTKDISFDGEIVLRGANYGEPKLTIVDNYHWLKRLNYIDFLRLIGVHFSTNKLIKMDSMSSRLHGEQNLSFIELNYPLLQAYDFYYLKKHYGCNCQLGGSDQWGNMLRGVELIHKMGEGAAYCITMPLVLRSDGRKMGKSEDGAVWLNPAKLDDESYWQYFRNVDDKDIDKFLRIFTDLPVAQITEGALPSNINARKDILATYATTICRGKQNAERTQRKMQSVFKGECIDASLAEEIQSGISIVEAIVILGLSASKSEARRTISSGGVRINGEVVSEDCPLKPANINRPIGAGNEVTANDSNIFVLSVGKRHRKVVRIV